MSEVQGVILDIDGTLIRSNDAHAEAFVEAGRALGHDVEFREVRPLIGMGGDKLVPRVFGVEEESEAGRALTERKGEIFRGRLLPDLQPTPGARALLEALRARGLPLTVATSASEDDRGALLERAGVDDLLSGGPSAGEVEETKPAPDVVEAALRELGTEAERTVLVGDTPYDVEAARRAGVRVVALRCGGWTDADLADADAVFEDPADLLRNLDRSPLAAEGG